MYIVFKLFRPKYWYPWQQHGLDKPCCTWPSSWPRIKRIWSIYQQILYFSWTLNTRTSTIRVQMLCGTSETREQVSLPANDLISPCHINITELTCLHISLRILNKLGLPTRYAMILESNNQTMLVLQTSPLTHESVIICETKTWHGRPLARSTDNARFLHTMRLYQHCGFMKS